MDKGLPSGGKSLASLEVSLDAFTQWSLSKVWSRPLLPGHWPPSSVYRVGLYFHNLVKHLSFSSDGEVLEARKCLYYRSYISSI